MRSGRPVRHSLGIHDGRRTAIDEVPERLAIAAAGGAETINFSEIDVYDELMKRTDKRGPDSCIVAVAARRLPTVLRTRPSTK
jgi:threonine dehydrogenase-like Zn-dependent dehydrogenase